MSQKLVFFVDDDKMILHLLEYVFHNMEEYTFRSFTSGEDCLRFIDLNPDVIVLDHLFTLGDRTMMSGMETLKKILDVNKAAKVIMLTSQENKELIPEFIKTGAKKYIAKDSYFIDSLVDAIKEIA
jgi:DNA-binding NtrC family response regulator